MSDPNASWHEMPGFTLPGWLGHDGDEQLLDTILAGRPLPPSAPREYHAVAEQLASLARPTGPGPLPGETAALAAFSSSVFSGSLSSAASATNTARTSRLGRARRSGLLTASRARIAAALTTLGLVLGTTAAAYAGALPAPVQDIAHRMIGAPAAPPGGSQHAHGQQGRGQQGRGQQGPASARPSHQPPGQRDRKTPAGKANGHAQHPRPEQTGKPARTPKPHSPKPASPGHRGQSPRAGEIRRR